MTERILISADRVWLIRAMCHVESCHCADRGGIADDYDACRLVSRHANAIMRAGGEKTADGEHAGMAKIRLGYEERDGDD